MTEEKECRYFVESIKSCRVDYRQGSIYRLKCKIPQLGEKWYDYTAGDNCLAKDNKKYFLGGKALCAISKALRKFDKAIACIAVQKQDNMTAVFDQLGLTLFLRHKTDEDSYEALFETDCGNGICRLALETALQPYDLLHRVRCNTEIDGPEYLFRPDPENLHEHPLYMAAVSYGNTLLKSEFELYYGYAKPDILDYLQKKKKIRLLPKLGKESNREYVINWLDFSVIRPVLELSGYRMLHTPSFRMWYGRTNTNKRINPHDKYTIDSAPIDEEPISLSEFFNLFGPDNSNT